MSEIDIMSDDELFDPEDVDGDEIHCRGCGCSNLEACSSGCFWVEPNLCSSCASSGGDA